MASSSFWEEQKHRRQASFYWLAWSVFLVLILSVSLGFFLLAVILGQFNIFILLLDIFLPVPDFFTNLLPAFESTLTKINTSSNIWLAVAGGLELICWISPGLGMGLLVWWSFFIKPAPLICSHYSIDTFVLNQAKNVLEEISIAANSPKLPQLGWIQHSAVNAAIQVQGSTASLLLTEGMLRELNREQLQAVVAHLIAWWAQGSYRIARGVTALIQTQGFILTVLDLPFGSQPWRELRKTFGYLRAKHSDVLPIDLMKSALDMRCLLNFFDVSEEEKRVRFFIKSFLILFLLPLILGSILARVYIVVLMLILIGPALILVLRRRRYLADATAVEFTRNPQSVFDAISRMHSNQFLDSGSSEGWMVDVQKKHNSDNKLDKDSLFVISLFPDIEKRKDRLVAMGAVAG